MQHPQPLQPPSIVRRDVSRYCPQCNGLDAVTTGTATSQASDTVQFARACPCGHQWVDVVQGGPFLAHVRRAG